MKSQLLTMNFEFPCMVMFLKFGNGYFLYWTWRKSLILLLLRILLVWCWNLLIQSGLTKVKIGKRLVSKLEQMVDLCFLGVDLKIQCIWRRIWLLKWC
jgi:hypothetical protein